MDINIEFTRVTRNSEKFLEKSPLLCKDFHGEAILYLVGNIIDLVMGYSGFIAVDLLAGHPHAGGRETGTTP